MVGVVSGISVVGGVGIVGWLEFLWKFRRGVRGSGKIKVGGKRWFVDYNGQGEYHF